METGLTRKPGARGSCDGGGGYSVGAFYVSVRRTAESGSQADREGRKKKSGGE